MIKLRELRTSRNLKQKTVYEALGMLPSTYNQYETGKRNPDYETACCLADYFGVTLGELLGRDESAYSQEGLPNMYYHLAKNAQELELSREDVDKILKFARELKDTNDNSLS